MDTWAARIRLDPHTLAGHGVAPLDEVLDEVAEAFRRRPFPLLAEIKADRPIVVIGDSHGDWPAVSSALTHAKGMHPPARFLALGDYIHRATRSQPDPTALPGGSIWNAAFLLAWAAHDPESVVLLRGNHEAIRQIPVPAPTLLRELRRLYPPSDALRLWDRITGLLEQLPLAARSKSGIFFVHGGIPPKDRFDPASWRANDLELLEGLLWSDPDFEYEERWVGQPYSLTDLDAFLAEVGCRFMIKGHAPNHSGRVIWDGRVLTVHTSDLFVDFGEGGVLLAEVPARERIESLEEVRLREWNGKEWASRPSTVVPTTPASAAALPPPEKPIFPRASRSG